MICCEGQLMRQTQFEWMYYIQLITLKIACTIHTYCKHTAYIILDEMKTDFNNKWLPKLIEAHINL